MLVKWNHEHLCFCFLITYKSYSNNLNTNRIVLVALSHTHFDHSPYKHMSLGLAEEKKYSTRQPEFTKLIYCLKKEKKKEIELMPSILFDIYDGAIQDNHFLFQCREITLRKMENSHFKLADNQLSFIDKINSVHSSQARKRSSFKKKFSIRLTKKYFMMTLHTDGLLSDTSIIYKLFIASLASFKY